MMGFVYREMKFKVTIHCFDIQKISNKVLYQDFLTIVVCLEIQPKTTKVLHKIGTRIRLSKLRNDSNVGDYISIKRDRVNTKK